VGPEVDSGRHRLWTCQNTSKNAGRPSGSFRNRRIASASSKEAAQEIAEALAELDWETLQSDSVPHGLQIAVSSTLQRYEAEIDYPANG
jgi:hypothetical protein